MGEFTALQTEQLPGFGVPTHVIPTEPMFGNKSMCGKKNPYPQVLQKFVAEHVERRNMVVCPECKAVMEKLG